MTPLVTLAGPARGAVLQAARHASAQAPISFSGTVSPDDAGAVVALQRERPLGSGRWRRVAATRVGDDGGFTFEHAFHAAGPLLLRAFLHSHAHRLAALSETLSYEVASAQDPALTISASAQSLGFGESVTVSGTLAGPAGVTATLQARSGDGVFSAVASTTTTEGGAYTFTQTPARDIDYRVTSGAQRSVLLRVQVAFALTATPSATTVASGEGFVISGKVEPASPGARVYLQRLTQGGATWSHTRLCDGPLGLDVRDRCARGRSRDGELPRARRERAGPRRRRHAADRGDDDGRRLLGRSAPPRRGASDARARAGPG